MPGIPVLRRLRRRDQEFQSHLELYRKTLKTQPQLSLFCSPTDKFLKALKDEKLQGLKMSRQPGKSASCS
jgi:hypothetical protein